MNEQLPHALKLVFEKLTSWYELSIKLLPNFIVAILVLGTFYLLSSWIKNSSQKIFRTGLKSKPLSGLLSTITQFVIMALGLFIALGVLNLDKTVTSLLAGAGVIGLALGFAFQEIASNFVSGIFIAFKEPYKIGDIVEIEGFVGRVKTINLRTTILETFQGIEVYVPNKSMFTKPLQNISGTPKRRVDIKVGVSYAEDLRQVTALIKTSLKSLRHRLQESPVEVFFQEFGDSSINCEVRIWITYPNHQAYLETTHETIVRIKEAFDDNGISIPFPIRTLDFGIKGGEKLEKPLSEVFSDSDKRSQAN